MFARSSLGICILACFLSACSASGVTTTPSAASKSEAQPAAIYTPATTILPDSLGAIDPMQIIDLKMTPQQIQQEAPYEDLVWGAFDPADWLKYGKSTLILSWYFMPFNDDSSLGTYCNLQCWQTGPHPDWVMYACDSTGNPVIDGQSEWAARDDGFPDVPLDIHNPQVVQYQMNNLIPYLKAHGYNAVAADNITFLNYLGGPNTLLGQNDPDQIYDSDGWYGCGIYQNGNFVRRYAGPNGGGPGGWHYADPTFIADLVNWVQTVEPILHQNGIKLLINHPIGAPGDPNEQALITHTDALAYEASFTNFDRWHANFPAIIKYMHYAQTNHVAYMDVDYFCENIGKPCEKALTVPQKEFAIASYELGNNGGAGLFMSPSGGQKYSYYPEFQTKVGTPCGDYYAVPGTTLTYARKFMGGFVAVNNNYTGGPTESVKLPSHTYVDMEGRTVTNPLKVAPLDAYVLTTTANGCT